MKNFYPEQYKKDNSFNINHNYLTKQFEDYEDIFYKIKDVIIKNDFTLGEAVDEVEYLIAKECNTKYAVGVGSGTDALMLSLKALGVNKGDEVITCTYTFYATVGAIVTAGAKPIFCDCREDYNIDVNQIEDKITEKTKAIVPIHWTGKPCDMKKLNEISHKYAIPIVEDACHALQAEYYGKRCGSFGKTGCFSFHPLKNLNVWGDGGIIVTNDQLLSEKLKLIRNHGLTDRNTCIEFSYNSRLDTIQAVVAKHLIENKLENITNMRIKNALHYDSILEEISQITTQIRHASIKEVFHLYTFQTENRDELASFLQKNGVDAKIHYPIPMHLQPASKKYGYSYGDFPMAENLCKSTISLPVHEFILENDITKVGNLIKQFFNQK
tara:strand:+ start:1083 stop:2231 length:1149 start_codon:yes stop_codon:yes gene_type:complete